METKKEIDESEKLFKERKEKILSFLKKPSTIVIGSLIIAIILGIYIRSLPMQDHGGHPGLWDIAKNDWTLGPDLDPWLFTRSAKIIVEKGYLPKMDYMRNVPLGFDNSKETVLLPYMIAWTHKFLNLFGNYPIEFSASLFPVIMFVLTIVAFFLFVREIFIRKSTKSKIQAGIIASISTFFMIVIPTFLPRTVAGIPEKESAVFFFIFLAFYLFLKSWKSKNMKKVLLFGILSGVSTSLGGMISGLYMYIFITISFTGFLAFILNKFRKKQKIIAYSLWWFVSVLMLSTLPGKANLRGMLTSVFFAPAFVLILVITLHYILLKLKFFENKKIENFNLPPTLITLILVFSLIIISLLILNPSYLFNKLKDIHQILFKPVVGRWNTTVAENRQPYFTEWERSFGPLIGNIPVIFWLFFIGSVLLFRRMVKKIKKIDSWILTGGYILFFFGLVFSRYSSKSIFNGENFISQAFYYLGVLAFLGTLIYYYVKYYRKNDRTFEKIRTEYFLLINLFWIMLFSARGAVRLIMVLGPVAGIMVGFLNVESFNIFKKSKDEILRIFTGAFFVLVLILTLFSFNSYYKTIHVQSYSYVPSYYNQQWQKAMAWVRNNTPKNAVFGHWWDYGYWVQSIGERPTVLDGGNAITFWNYWMGRLVLTGDNQKDALEFLYAHNTSYFLIDSSDIGKYGAFSSIGSDKNYDRFSWFGTFLLDDRRTLETKNKTTFYYVGGVSLDEDLIIKRNGREILLPQRKAGVGMIILSTKTGKNNSSYIQPSIKVVYQGQVYTIPLKYLYINGKFIKFKDGIDACAFIFPRLDSNNGRMSENPIGAALYLSPRLMRGMLTQKYILNDPFNKFPNFKLVHTEPNLIIESLRNQGLNLPDFVYYHGIQGPIKIWKIVYTGNETIKQKYLDTDSSKYLSWKL